MLLAHPIGRPATSLDPADGADAALPVWLDMLEPTEDERSQAGRLTGLRIPTRQQIEEIESSSRVFMEGEVFYLSTPLVRRIEGRAFSAPLGLVMGRERLITIRYSDYKVFETVGQKLAGLTETDQPRTGGDIMLLLLDAIIDRLADLMEQSGRELDQLSKTIFQSDQGGGNASADRRLRGLLGEVGRQTDLVSSVRDSLLGLQRIILYLGDNDSRSPPERFVKRLALLSKDIASLNDYDGQLNTKVQFLLDATLGFINIEQNNGIKILTVVSIVGIPPTLIASIYGMNFKNIPELSWGFGYWYALGLMAATVVLPMIWFWRRGWLGGR